MKQLHRLGAKLAGRPIKTAEELAGRAGQTDRAGDAVGAQGVRFAQESVDAERKRCESLGGHRMKQPSLLRQARRDAFLLLLERHGPFELNHDFWVDMGSRGWNRAEVNRAIEDLLEAGLAVPTGDEEFVGISAASDFDPETGVQQPWTQDFPSYRTLGV